TLMIAERYLDPLKREEIDTLLLGCTHYPLLKGIIKKIMGNGIPLIDSAQETAIEVERILYEKRILRESSHKGRREYFVTDAPGRFIKLGERFLGIRIDNVKQINT
ncbi:MAG: aspartate/glutamate racemase family protein, partial [Nitrospirae bacterium]|nr:aspartate/glutamate racemase family protein [Nitrospirota bacterium]